MGAPKQKWTAEEEAALKAGVVKHGAGKWRTILKDPEFSGVLCSRSNVDLKDKWRNLSVTANGWGSREKARALKRSRQTPKHDGSSKAVRTMYEDDDDELMESKSLATNEYLHIAGQKRSFSRTDNLILEAIKNLKEPSGSNKTAIATYIEDQYWPPPDFAELLSDKLKELTASGRLIRVKRKYRMAPTSAFPSGKTSKLLIPEGRQSEPSRTIRDDLKPFSRFQVDAELGRMQSMTAQQAAAIAAQAVAEAEAAMAEAEAAAREAEAAEADAEVAQAFAEAVMLTMKNKNKSNLVA
ncbi:single myb histone 6-like [Zingiber officinale]|uniref:single myb histone 6-like n=1 Tax=Zingiber officinale TaxID=94328 RepID=UPI001C4CFD65|nr:single myb histone 6-like [Zingiber officinale]XP_042417712.1 single myb histone 6-like [Zingiber officinale]XP_042417713.1 single myb histone 6-like [Zingiber officinale]